MKKILILIALIVFCKSIFAQRDTIPHSPYTKFDQKWYKFLNYISWDSIGTMSLSDTTQIPYRAGGFTAWMKVGEDTANPYFYDGQKWKLFGGGGSGGGNTYTVNNGLTENPSFNFQLGGTLVQNTTITGGGFISQWTSTSPSTSTMTFTNSSSGGALTATASGANYAITSQNAQDGIATFLAWKTPFTTSTNTVVPVIEVSRSTSGTPGNGIGGSIDYKIATTASGAGRVAAGSLVMKWADATNASRLSEFTITGSNADVPTDLFTLSGTGALRLNNYGAGTFTGTPFKSISETSTGNIIETDFVAPTIFNGCVSGCIVTWDTLYTYIISPSQYYINGQFYQSPADTITLDAADPTDDRIDVFVVNTSSANDVVEGAPANPALQPDIDETTQLQISFAVVGANTTSPVIDTLTIYKENTGPPAEWTYADNSATLNPASTNNPYQGLVDIEGTNVVTGNALTLTSSVSVDYTRFALLNFKILLKTGFANSLTLRFQNGNTVVGSTIVLSNGQYGFSISNVTTYQNISIPLAFFGNITNANVLRIAKSGATAVGFYIDNIILIEGNLPPEQGIQTVTATAPITATTNGSSVNIGLTTPLSAIYGGTGQSGYTTGDIIYASGTTTLAKLAIGTSAQHLVVVGGLPAWRDTTATGGGGTVTDFIFTDANGFDGTVTTSTSTPTLSLTTTVANTRVMYSNSGAITGAAGMTFNGTSTLTLGVAGASLGTLNLTGNTSGTVSINTAAAAGTWALTLPTTGGTNNHVLTTNGSGVTTWAAPIVSISSLTAAVGTNTIDNTNLLQEWQWNSLAGGNGLKLSSSSTAAASNTQTLFVDSIYGANATASQTTYAAKFLNWHTGTTSTNVALYASATGGTTANYGLLVANGDVGIGTTTPNGKFVVQGNPAIIRFAYDATNNTNFTTQSNGGIVSSTNSTGTFQFNQPVTIAGALYSSTATSGNFSLKGGSGIETASPFPALTPGGANLTASRFQSNATTTGTVTANLNYVTFGIGSSAVTMAASGTHGIFANQAIKGLNITSGAGTLSNAASLYIEGAATGTGAPTNNYSLWIDAGLNRLDGNTSIGLSAAPSAILHLGAGSTTAGTAPIKLASGGVLMTTPEEGSIEYDGTNLFFSPSSSRYTIYTGLAGSASLDFGSIASLGNASLTITVTGAADGDPVELGTPNGSFTAGLIYTAWVSAANTVSIQVYNSTLGAIDPTSGTFKVFVKKN